MSTGWIPATERLPTESETDWDRFVVWNGKWRVLAAWLRTDQGLRFCDHNGTPIRGVTHWLQHAPVPPSGGAHR